MNRAEQNPNGLTWERWLAASGWVAGWYSSVPSLEMVRDWRAGVDPADWRVLFENWRKQEVK